ncbi:MAG TPA: HAD family hydrolase [Candidatus Limnocylindrales bacterium]|nr:HAD family hydrolase [Candidatus Limnocylindrales bacterium]
MAERQPVLVVDVGGTLVTRTRMGQTERIVEAVRLAKGLSAEAEGELRRTVLTSADAEACLRALNPPHGTRLLVAGELAADPGEAIVLPGAEDLLRAAVETGWRVVVASNAGPGTPELPDSLARHVSAVVESRRCGLVKEDPRFWTKLVDTERVDPHLALVVGDQPQADRDAPAAAGLQSRLVREGELALLAADLAAAGPPPPDAFAVLGGDHEPWAGREIVVAPHLCSLLTRVTRARVKYVAGQAEGIAVVARRTSGSPAVLGPGDALPGVAWLVPGRERSPYTIPAGLRGVLEGYGLSLDVLSTADRRHALSMIREARSDTTVAQRTADLVRFLRERSKDGLLS